MKNYRDTKALSEIRKLIQDSSIALSHAEILSMLDGLCDRVTVYRILERLVKENIIHKIINVDGVLKFASCTQCKQEHEHNHIHFSCEKCKMVVCLNDISPVFQIPSSYIIKQMNFTVAGLCPACA